MNGLKLFAGLSAVIVACALAGCHKTQEESGGAAAPAGNVSPGKAVYDANGCVKCHVINGVGGRNGRGVDLSRIGADAMKNAAWITAHVRNPKTQNAMSKMPPFEGKITEVDLQAVANYLAGLK